MSLRSCEAEKTNLYAVSADRTTGKKPGAWLWASAKVRKYMTIIGRPSSASLNRIVQLRGVLMSLG